MIRGIIFDLDGTLIDSMGIWAEADELFLQRRGISVPDGLEEKLKTMSSFQAAEYYRTEFSLSESPQEIWKEFEEITQEAYCQKIPALPGALEFVRRMKCSGKKLCVATATSRPLAESALKRLRFWEEMDFLITCDELKCSKNSGEIFHYAAQQLSLSEKEVVVFEDALHAAQAAKKAGFLVAGIYERHLATPDEIQQMKQLCDWYFYSYEMIQSAFDTVEM